MIAAADENVLCNQSMDLDDLMPCNIEEADERMLLHVNHAAKQFSKHLIKTVDSDVIVIAVTVFDKLNGVNELWIEYGKGKTLKYIPIHEIARSMGDLSSRAISFFHALSGCDTTSAVAGKGKLSFYHTWSLLPEITTTFDKLGNVTDINEITEDDFKTVERFFVALYSPTLNTEEVNVARQILFTKGNRSIENIPPTSNCLQKHIIRSCHQATNWSNALKKQRLYLDPVLWGWRKSGKCFVPMWSDLPQASEACRELIRCGCKKTCRGRCKCKKNDLACSDLCACSGQCAANN